MEAWWYMVLEWMTGELPWKHVKVRTHAALFVEMTSQAVREIERKCCGERRNYEKRKT